jgi:hypothetical protein
VEGRHSQGRSAEGGDPRDYRGFVNNEVPQKSHDAATARQTVWNPKTSPLLNQTWCRAPYCNSNPSCWIWLFGKATIMVADRTDRARFAVFVAFDSLQNPPSYFDAPQLSERDTVTF